MPDGLPSLAEFCAMCGMPVEDLGEFKPGTRPHFFFQAVEFCLEEPVVSCPTSDPGFDLLMSADGRIIGFRLYYLPMLTWSGSR